MNQLSIFLSSDYYSSKWYIFKNTELGRIHGVIPWDDLSKCFPESNKDKPGATSKFSNAGMFAVMFLKHYTGLSDEKLIARINTDWAMQLFCGLLLTDNEQIKDTTIVSRIRSKISKQVNLLDDAQLKLVSHWSGSMNSCYESYIRFPTDVKLLWECCEWVFSKQLYPYCKKVGIKRPRNKYRDQTIKQVQYNRKRRKTYSQTRSRKRALLNLLTKGLIQLKEALATHQHQHKAPISYYITLGTVEKVLEQQQYLFDHSLTQVSDRIVSIHKPYVRTIKRGKENKSTEFGMKLHKVQVDKINQIEYMSFENFNECTRLKSSVTSHQSLFGSCTRLGADQIYATNKNRSYLSSLKITTCFPKKGRDLSSKEEKELRSQLGKRRSTYLEGSFGNEKNHYGLRKVKALSEGTEKVWVFFGIMTANALQMSKRKIKIPDKELVAAA